MQEKGISEEKILEILQKRLVNDQEYSTGRILSSMCTNPLEISKKTYSFAVEKNIGDESLFQGSVDVEKETVSMLGDLLSNSHASGHIVSGGTEANITALWIAKKQCKEGKNEIILPRSAHFSFERAADILGLKLIEVSLTNEFKIDTSKVRNEVNRKTLAIIGIAGSTHLGAVDEIPELSDIALENDLYLHVDAAFGGFVLPFLKELGLYEGIFDFEAPGVKSITIDPHKMGLCPIPAGGILFRDASFLSTINKTVDYIGLGKVNLTTLQGTRPAAPSIAVWAAMKSLGRSGYRSIVKKCIENTSMLYNELKKLDEIQLIVKPTMNIIGFTCSGMDDKLVVDKLLKKGWIVSLCQTFIRILVMPHTESKHLQAFISDLKEILSSIKESS